MAQDEQSEQNAVTWSDVADAFQRVPAGQRESALWYMLGAFSEREKSEPPTAAHAMRALTCLSAQQLGFAPRPLSLKPSRDDQSDFVR